MDQRPTRSKGGPDRDYSAYLDREDFKGKRGARAYDREAIYRFMFDNSDRYGIIRYKQPELARMLDVTKQFITYTMQDFVAMRMLVKHGRDNFECMVDPDAFDWGITFQEKQSELRKSHQSYYKNKSKENI